MAPYALPGPIGASLCNSTCLCFWPRASLVATEGPLSPPQWRHSGTWSVRWKRALPPRSVGIRGWPRPTARQRPARPGPRERPWRRWSPRAGGLRNRTRRAGGHCQQCKFPGRGEDTGRPKPRFGLGDGPCRVQPLVAGKAQRLRPKSRKDCLRLELQPNRGRRPLNSGVSYVLYIYG